MEKKMVKREFVGIIDTLGQITPKVLVKDLKDDERICPTCKGLGIVPVNRVYGIQGDTSSQTKQSMFPYNHQTFVLCPHCYNGVQVLCKYCGNPIKKGWINKCDCEGYKKEQEEKRLVKWNETIAKAAEVDIEDVTNMLYCEETGDFYTDVEDFIEQWECNHEEDEKMPERLWVTEKVKLSIDASNIIEDACCDLHEDARENCDYKELQELLDNWCEKQTGATTYYPCYEEYISVKKGVVYCLRNNAEEIF